jgi:hypothetical protein
VSRKFQVTVQQTIDIEEADREHALELLKKNPPFREFIGASSRGVFSLKARPEIAVMEVVEVTE